MKIAPVEANARLPEIVLLRIEIVEGNDDTADHAATPSARFLEIVDCETSALGDIGVPLSSAEIYDPDTDSFSTTGTLSTGRFSASAALLSDGKILIASGADPNNIDNSIASAELYDPVAY